MNKIKKCLLTLAFIFTGVLVFALASKTPVHAEGTTVTYTVTSKTEVSVTGTAPEGSSAVYTQTHSTPSQATAGNSFTLTLSGFEGYKITGISLSMKSNSKTGSGTLSVTAGTTTIASIEDSKFNSTNWNGAWSTTYVDVNVTLTNSDRTIKENENVVIGIAASANSLYCQSYSITYETGVVEVVDDSLLAPECKAFKELDLQEQLAFHYEYDKEFEVLTTLEEGKDYYLGNKVDDLTYVAVSENSTGFSASSAVESGVKFNFVFVVNEEETDYFAIVENSRYLFSGSTTNVSKSATSSYDASAKYLWKFDESTGRITNKSTGRYLCFTDSSCSDVKAYASSNSKLAVTLVSTTGAVSFTDAASNSDRVTMRIGYTISKELYEGLEALGTNVEFGVRLNDKTNVACTKVEVDENNYRLVVAVNNIPLDKIDTVLTACGYVTVDGTDYYTTDVNTYSVRSLAEEYLTNHADNEAVAAAKYALIYLAYYA